MVEEIKNSLLCVCVWGGGGGGGGGGARPGEVIHLFQTVCGVCGAEWWGAGEEDWEGDSLISNCIEKSSQ